MLGMTIFDPYIFKKFPKIVTKKNAFLPMRLHLYPMPWGLGSISIKLEGEKNKSWLA